MIKKSLITSWATAFALLAIIVQTIAPVSASFVFDYSRITSNSNQATSASFDLTGSVVEMANSGSSTDFEIANVYATATSSITCGNNVKEVGEACDGIDFGGQSCSSYGYNSGSLQCLNSCQQTSSANCYNTSSGSGGGGYAAPREYALCGNGIVETGEECDDGGRTSGDGCDNNCKIEEIITPVKTKAAEIITPVTTEVTTTTIATAVITKKSPVTKIVTESSNAEPIVTKNVTAVTTSEKPVTEIVTEISTVESTVTKDEPVITNEALTVTKNVTLKTTSINDSAAIDNSTNSVQVIVNIESVSEPEIAIVENDQTLSTSRNYIVKDQHYVIAAESIEGTQAEKHIQLPYVRYLILVIFVFIVLSAHWIYRKKSKRFKKKSVKKPQKKKKKFLKLFSTILAILMTSQVFTPLSTLSADTNPKVINYEGKLLDSARSPVTSSVTMRFSFWNNADWTGTDTNGNGTINTGSANYGGWFEENTLTPNSDGTFDVELGNSTAIPTIDFSTHKYLQVEIKNVAEADTDYQLMDPTSDSGVDAVDRQTIGTLPFAENAERLDNTEIGLTSGDLATLGAGNVWDIGLIPGGSNTDTFVIDNDDTAAGDIELQFGTTLAKTLKYSQANSWFEFNANVSFGQNEIKNVAIDNLATAPITPVIGQIYHNTTDTNTYIWNGTVWEDITAGVGSSQNKSILLLPEYEKITISEDGVNNLASIHQGYDSTNDHPYFVLSSAQNSLQDLDVYLAVKIPDDFISWQAIPVQIYLKSLTAVIADNQLDISITDTDKAAATLTDATDLISATPDTWIQKSVTFSGTPAWTAGDFMMIRLNLQAKSNNKIYIGEVQLNYVGN